MDTLSILLYLESLVKLFKLTKKITNLVNKKSVSIEVIGDDNQTCLEQAKRFR